MPQFTLKGRWLKTLIFYTGLAVVVTAEKGELAIEPQQKV
ncbi:type I toxin-antitoxin system SymE family toxin [Citrobacter sp. wls708]|nr:type I toxin-antitoxin system SymE family toxin [Citrobacter sp. wls708]